MVRSSRLAPAVLVAATVGGMTVDFFAVTDFAAAAAAVPAAAAAVPVTAGVATLCEMELVAAAAGLAVVAGFTVSAETIVELLTFSVGVAITASLGAAVTGGVAIGVATFCFTSRVVS